MLRRRPLGVIWRDVRGATAVEFALIAAPFFFLLFSLIEVASILFISMQLESAVFKTARMVRTGQAQNMDFEYRDFRDEVCEHLIIGSCDKLIVNVGPRASFGDIDTSSPINDNGWVPGSEWNYDAGSPGEVMFVRVHYRWDLIMPSLNSGLANMSNNRRLITATSVFRNEPG